jgi:hypothetical protein
VTGLRWSAGIWKFRRDGALVRQVFSTDVGKLRPNKVGADFESTMKRIRALVGLNGEVAVCVLCEFIIRVKSIHEQPIFAFEFMMMRRR